MRFPATLVLLAVAAGCRAPDVAPTPLRGPAPRSVIVWPRASGPAKVGAEVFTGLDAAVRRRGYDVPAVAVGGELLRDAGLLDAEAPELARIGAALGTDAVLVLDVSELATETGRSLQHARWHFVWRLRATKDGTVLWSHEHRGNWHRKDTDDSDPLRSADDEMRITPIGGPAVPSFRDTVELVAWLHAHAMEHLPRRSPSRPSIGPQPGARAGARADISGRDGSLAGAARPGESLRHAVLFRVGGP